jgi:hypothetical protein
MPVFLILGRSRFVFNQFTRQLTVDNSLHSDSHQSPLFKHNFASNRRTIIKTKNKNDNGAKICNAIFLAGSGAFDVRRRTSVRITQEIC